MIREAEDVIIFALFFSRGQKRRRLRARPNAAFTFLGSRMPAGWGHGNMPL